VCGVQLESRRLETDNPLGFDTMPDGSLKAVQRGGAEGMNMTIRYKLEKELFKAYWDRAARSWR
jgi:hypothetical protein